MTLQKTLDGNEACAKVAHKLNEVIAIYPITPSSPMGEWADQWSSEGATNIWGSVPQVVEMQAEGGAAGAVHGALQAGALTTTFTASQGLLLMLPNMYKIAGELTPTVFHIAARSVAAQALSIFGDHSDVMATRQAGFAQLFANSVQEVHDFALVSTVASLKSRIPFLHIFDGFRTSHEINKIKLLPDSVLEKMMAGEWVGAHRLRGLTPDKPVMRGTAQNPDVFFQARESVNPYYLAVPNLVQETMDEFAELTGRQYQLFDYIGAPDAERVLVIMGSGAETAQETVEYLTGQGEKVGVVVVRLYRPFAVEAFLAALPSSTKAIAVLDRTKEPGATGEPLYQDVITALYDSGDKFARLPRVIGGRYGLSSKEFTPAMVKAVLDELSKASPKNHFTIGIQDDVTHTSLSYDSNFIIEPDSVIRAVFYGLGSDGTVGANKNAIKIIGENTDNHAQAYFVYDSKKAGAVTVSHLRFGATPIRSTYLVQKANFIGCHQFNFLERYDVLRLAARGATFLLNSPYSPEETWEHLPHSMQETIIEKQIQFYVVDGYRVAQETQMGRRINTIMQTCFFAIAGILPRDEAITAIKNAIEDTYSKRGRPVIEQNFKAVDGALAHMYKVAVPAYASSNFERLPVVPDFAPDFVKSVTARMIEGLGDTLPVSKMPADGTYPTGTTQWEKRNIADEIPVWDPDICIQCGKCVFVCPHSVIRMKLFDGAALADAPDTFLSAPARYKDFPDSLYSLQVSPEDCTGCTLCVDICPVKNKAKPKLKAINMAAQRPIREAEKENWEFFKALPEVDRTNIPLGQVKYSQLLQPLFEFSGACAGCGETPYLSLLSRLFGDRAIIANATGCSSIYGGNLPTTPWAKNDDGRGPAWSNSLFEDNAEFGMGMRVALDQRLEAAKNALVDLDEVVGIHLVETILLENQNDEAEIAAQRERVVRLKERLETLLKSDDPEIQNRKFKIKNLLSLADSFVEKSVWIVGGDGWAYDIGYGGLDHVLASGRNVNVLVLDTEVYSNTGGQMSKATPRGAVAKFAAGGKPTAKKDLSMLAVSYGNIYVAKVAFGAKDAQTIKAFREAESYNGPSLIIAYSNCIAHGYDMKFGLQQQQAAVDSGYWNLFRYDPRLVAQEKNPFQLDSRKPSLPLEKYMYREGRFRLLLHNQPDTADQLLRLAKDDVKRNWQRVEEMAGKEIRD